MDISFLFSNVLAREILRQRTVPDSVRVKDSTQTEVFYHAFSHIASNILPGHVKTAAMYTSYTHFLDKRRKTDINI